MSVSYTAIMFMAWMALIVQCIIVAENNRLDNDVKVRFWATYALIIIASLAEWAGIMLNNAPGWTKEFHVYTKFLDYCTTPMVAYFVGQQIIRKNKFEKPMLCIFAGNIVLQFLSTMTGWTFYVDDANVYHHGPLYPVYMLIYAVAILYVLVGYIGYGSKFQKQNKWSLGAIVVLTACGILAQEVVGGNLRLACLSLALGAILLYAHYNEYSLQQSDLEIVEKNELLNRDALTGILSRFAYTRYLKQINASEKLKKDLVVYVVDINQLKHINDTLGHDAGDEIIDGAAHCIMDALGPYGKIFRVGGDEFVAVLHLPEDEAEISRQMLYSRVEKWQGELVKTMTLSVGYAIYSQENVPEVENLVSLADRMMYKEKARFYKKSGLNRRKTDPYVE